MDPKDKPAAGAATAATMVEQLAEAQARGFAEGKAASKAEHIAEGMQMQQTRIAAILTHVEADGRRTLAEHLAFKTGSTVEDAVALLASAPKQAPGTTNLLAEAMAGVPNPRVGAGSADDAVLSGPRLDTGRVYQMRREATKAAS